MPPSGRQTTAQERTSSLAMPPVKIVEVARVAVPAAAETAALIWLSALDAPWLSFALMQSVFIFEFEDEDDHTPPFPSIVASLRASLESTLARFLPLAGRIIFLPSTGDAAIDCSQGGGVRFVVAEADDADAGRLSGDADHDMETFRRLVPGLEVGALPAEALAVQVTRLRGGVAVGVAMHHAVADGRSAWRFFEAWAASCRGDMVDTTAPSFDRTAVELPGGRQLVRSTLRKYTPDLPLAPQAPVGPIVPRRTFIVTEQHLNRLKQRITDLTSTPTSAAAFKPSSFVAVSALSWASFVRAKHPSVVSADNDVYLFFLKDCRGQRGGFNPPVRENYFGSCVTGCLAKAMARDLLAEDGVATAAVALEKAVRRAAEDPLAMWDWMALKSLPLDRVLNISGSTRFQAYEATDFGWGAPSRTELVSMKNDRQVVLVAAKGGVVQASAVMHPDHMDSFSSHFLRFLN